MGIGIPFIDKFRASKMRSKPLPADRVNEKSRLVMPARDYAHRPLPTIPMPVPVYPVIPVSPTPQHIRRTTSHRGAETTHPHKRTRTISQGPPLRSILKNKGQTNAPPMQASGGSTYDCHPRYASQTWTAASMQQGARGGYSAGQLDHHTGRYPPAVDAYHYPHAYNGANEHALPDERRRVSRANTYRGRPPYQSDSPVSDDSDHGGNDRHVPLAVLQVRASNYISAYVRPVRMKPEVYHLDWPLKPTRPDKHGKILRRIYFDIAFDPRENDGRRIYLFDQAVKRPISKDELNLSATTHCTLTDMTIVHNDPHYALWPVKVHRKEGIRCIDVFAAIYDAFHKPVKAEDPIAEEEQQSAERYNYTRCHDASGLFEYNRRQGLLRVDILRSHRIFAGLEQDDTQWKLYLASYSP